MPASVQDTTILHAWNWSVNNVYSQLDAIKEAGYKTIQLSPMQPAKDGGSGSWNGSWWKLYQPYGFKVATGGENAIGTKDDLKKLTAKAKEKGIRVIVDVVANHLAEGSKYYLDSRVRNYEQAIYDGNLIHGAFDTSDNTVREVVQGSLNGLPDLKTENSVVQNRVISLLKEYMDCGVSGFRFDAAKHIETDEDGQYASSFWANIASVANEYGRNVLSEPAYMYGEILYKPGANRTWSAYTKRMSVIDNNQGTAVLASVKSNVPSAALARFNVGQASNAVLWAESHDTYANDEHETTGVDQEKIDKAYCIQATRANASALYFVRPSGSSSIGSIGTYAWKNATVAAANRFHSFFAGSEENAYAENGCYLNARSLGGKNGVAIVALGATDGVQIDVHVPDGSYTNLVNGTTVNVSEGKVKTAFTKGVMILSQITKEGQTSSRPFIDISAAKTAFEDETDVTVEVDGATNAYYQIDDGKRIALPNGKSTFKVGKDLPNGSIEVKVVAASETGSRVRRLSLTKTSLASMGIVIANVPTSAYLIAWTWPNSGSGSWCDITREGNLMGFNPPNKNFLLVRTSKAKKASEMTWSDKVAQTDDMTYTGAKIVLDYNSLTWK